MHIGNALHFPSKNDRRVGVDGEEVDRTSWYFQDVGGRAIRRRTTAGNEEELDEQQEDGVVRKRRLHT